MQDKKSVLPYAALALICFGLFFFRLGSEPLIGLDESLYGECSREMFVSGNYLVPSVNGTQFFDKPPLVYWTQAASMHIFGINSLAVRLPSALSALLLISLIVYLGSRLYNRRAGLFAGFIAASTMLTMALARMCLMDQMFTLTIAASLGAFLLAYLELTPRWSYLIFWTAMALSVMVKGPAGAVLIVTTVLAFLLIKRDIRAVKKIMPLPGLMIFFAIAMPWYMLVQKETGGTFLKEFIIHQNIQRAMGKDFHHNLPFYSYLPIYLVGFFPWSIFMPLAWKDSVKLKSSSKEDSASLFIAVWIAAIVVIFSVSKSKLPSYIYPVFPPSALLIGYIWHKTAEIGKLGSIRRYTFAALIMSTIVSAAMVFSQKFLNDPIPGLSNALIPMGVFLFLGTLLAFILLVKRRVTAALAALCGGMACFLMVAMLVGLPIASTSLSEPMLKIAEVVKVEATPKDTVIAYPSQPLVAFYANRPVFDVKTPKALNAKLNHSASSLVITKESKSNALPKYAKLIAEIKSGPSDPFRVYRIK